MSYTNFLKTELTAAVGRGVRQCVVIASGAELQKALSASPDQTMSVFVVGAEATNGVGTLAAALEKSDFDKLKSGLFVWLGGASSKALDGVLATLGFIASLPKGTGLILNYVAEQTTLGSKTSAALDALASRIGLSGESAKYLVQPEAVNALLSGLGFRQIADLARQDAEHLVSAVV